MAKLQGLVCPEVLPDIRKCGVYVSKATSIVRIKVPTGETKLHCKIKKHTQTTYPA